VKLNLGCGRTRREGWVNVDCTEIPGVTDVVCDLDGTGLLDAFELDSVEQSVGEHVIEHLARPLDFMAALWQVTKPDGIVSFETPYGSSDDAWEDPTHVRPYFMQSWGYFSQPFYFRADYGYAADWKLIDLSLGVGAARWQGRPTSEVLEAVQRERNVVDFMRATLRAVKPARPADASLRSPLPLSFALVGAE
jgi:SAM-dependent methyltransferase